MGTSERNSEPELSVTGGGTYGEHGEEAGEALHSLQSPGSSPVEKPGAARYLLMKRDDFTQLWRCFNLHPGAAVSARFPFLEALGEAATTSLGLWGALVLGWCHHSLSYLFLQDR